MIEAVIIVAMIGAEYAVYTYTKRINDEINKKLRK